MIFEKFEHGWKLFLISLFCAQFLLKSNLPPNMLAFFKYKKTKILSFFRRDGPFGDQKRHPAVRRPQQNKEMLRGNPPDKRLVGKAAFLFPHCFHTLLLLEVPCPLVFSKKMIARHTPADFPQEEAHPKAKGSQ